jgi:hypothetical protein
MKGELIHRFEEKVRVNGKAFVPCAYAAERPDGTWQAWLEFTPEDSGPTLTTGQETSQPNRQAIVYWASGLEPIYLEGALGRARIANS